MSTARPEPSFAVWLTGLPASGKSTIRRALVEALRARGVHPAVLESDALRQVMAAASYGESEREAFYRTMAWIGALLADHGVPVIFDATANKRAYREDARKRIPHFIEVHVDTPLEVCIERDPKGIYHQGMAGEADAVPGLQAPYEPPVEPELVVSGVEDSSEEAAERIVQRLAGRGYLKRGHD